MTSSVKEKCEPDASAKIIIVIIYYYLLTKREKQELHKPEEAIFTVDPSVFWKLKSNVAAGRARTVKLSRIDSVAAISTLEPGGVIHIGAEFTTIFIL